MGLTHDATLSLSWASLVLGCLAACGSKSALDLEPGDAATNAGLGGTTRGEGGASVVGPGDIGGSGGILGRVDGSVGAAGAVFDASIADVGATEPPTWLLGFGDDAWQAAATIAVLPDGTSYVAGTFSGDVNFGDRVLNSVAGTPDAFVAKFDPRGKVAWSKGFGDEGYQQFVSAAVDAVGGVALVGQFSGAIDFGGGTLTSAGGYDLVIGHLDPSGAYVRSQRFGDIFNNQYGNAVAVAPGNKILAAGYFAGDLDPTVGIPSAGGADAFLFEFSSGGDRVLAKSFGNALAQRASGLAVHPNGIAMVGDFDGIIDFGAGNLVTKGDRDVFLVYFDPTGAVRFHRGFGSPGDQIGLAVAMDAGTEQIAIAGNFVGVIDLGCGTLTSAGGNDAFVAVLDAKGVCVWSARFGDSGEQFARAVKFDAMHRVVAVGSFKGTLDIGTHPSSAGTDDTFVLTWLDGNIVSTRAFGGAGRQFATGVGTDAASNVYVVGAFSDEISLGNEHLTTRGGNDIFFAKLAP